MAATHQWAQSQMSHLLGCDVALELAQYFVIYFSTYINYTVIINYYIKIQIISMNAYYYYFSFFVYFNTCFIYD